MKPKSFFVFFVALLACLFTTAQTKPVNSVKFFEDTSILKATIITDMRQLLNHKDKKGVHMPARFSSTFEDGTVIDQPISLETRGHFRKGYCFIPPLKVKFNADANGALKTLGSLKLVSQCSNAAYSETYLLDEFLVYKLYNLLTNMSFRVRLVNLNIVDSSGKKKPINEYAFFLEDDKDLAKRNNCKDWKEGSVHGQVVDRHQMIITSVFEYMIGNTDWSILVAHNINLLLSKTDSFQHLYPVPYDFDYSGLVNTTYAVPDPRLNIANVRERLYRGYTPTMEELDDIFTTFKNQKNNMYALIDNFQLLNARDKKDVISYLDEFFELIDQPNKVREAFFQNASKN